MIGDLDYELKSDGYFMLRFLLGSYMRAKLLLFMINNNGVDLDTLRSRLEKPSATILHSVKEFEAINLSGRDLRLYCLSSKGFLYGLAVDKLSKNLYIFESNRRFWETHHIDSFPTDFVKNAHLLRDSEFLVSDKRDLSKPVNDYFYNLQTCDSMKIILPFFSEIYLEIILENAQKGNDLTLIINEEVLNALKNSGHLKTILELSKKGNLEIRKYKGVLKLFLTFCNNFMSLNLFYKDGFFDDSVTLFNDSSDGVKWAKSIFEIYLEDSSLVIF